MTLKIISAEDIVFEGEVTMATLPGSMGAFTVLRNHASIVSTLVAGQLKYKEADGQEKVIDIEGGIVDVDNNVISVCIY